MAHAGVGIVTDLSKGVSSPAVKFAVGDRAAMVLRCGEGLHRAQDAQAYGDVLIDRAAVSELGLCVSADAVPEGVTANGAYVDLTNGRQNPLIRSVPGQGEQGRVRGAIAELSSGVRAPAPGSPPAV